MDSILQMASKQRLFAVVHMFGKQYLIKAGDLLMVNHHFPLECGQALKFNKCLVLGGKDFSLIGRPVLDKEVFSIDATVVEKTMSDTKCKYFHRERERGYKRFLYHADPCTVFRINNVELKKLPE